MADSPGREFATRLREAAIKPHEIARFLDGLSHSERVEAIRAAGRTEQRRLYDAVSGFAPLGLEDLVPRDRGELVPVRHFGVNTLPLFSHFEKRMCRPAGRAADEIWGFNFQRLSFLTGPGYFVARGDPARDEVRIDYQELPPTRPQAWPRIVRNDRGLARFVYGQLVDTLRRVSEHVSIGSAARGGRDIGSWFLLCREA